MTSHAPAGYACPFCLPAAGEVNEPGGGQAVWHSHLHVFPRWRGETACTAAWSRGAWLRMRGPGTPSGCARHWNSS